MFDVLEYESGRPKWSDVAQAQLESFVVGYLRASKHEAISNVALIRTKKA
jgi:hypothetical protein